MHCQNIGVFCIADIGLDNGVQHAAVTQTGMFDNTAAPLQREFGPAAGECFDKRGGIFYSLLGKCVLHRDGPRCIDNDAKLFVRKVENLIVTFELLSYNFV